MDDRHPPNGSIDRRRRPDCTDLGELLDAMPARVLLDRMPGPVIGVDPDGVVAYANPAATTLLGYPEPALVGRALPSLLVHHPDDTGAACVAALRAAGGGDVIDWCHAEGFAVRTAVSAPLLLRASDPYLMIYVTDVTELYWGRGHFSQP